MIILDKVAEKLFDYLRSVIYEPSNAVLDIKKLPEDFQDLGSGLNYFAECVIEAKQLATALARGDLTGKLPSRGNEIASPLKSLHATLKHLTWQTQQIAQGDYAQRVDFMGEFADAFNTMVEQLAERQQKLEDKIEQIQKKTESLEQGNDLLTALMNHVPQQIIVIDRDTRAVLLMNDMTSGELKNDPGYIENLMRIMFAHDDLDSGSEIEITYKQAEAERYLMIRTYFIEWHGSNAVVFTVRDVSDVKKRIEILETYAYRDSATQLYNRMFGMFTLDSWLHEKRQFVLIFADLDSLKYVNDDFGHNEGDMYILNAAKHLQTFSPDAVVCRIGGDEFMILAPNISYDEAYIKMSMVYDNLENDEYLNDKMYSYSISFGIAVAEPGMSASDILSISDEKMYENKRERKRARKQ